MKTESRTSNYMSIPMSVQFTDPRTLVLKVCSEFSMTFDTIREKTRTQDVLIPRQCMMKIIYENFPWSQRQVGLLFTKEGNKPFDHATVNHSTAQIEQLLAIRDKKTCAVHARIMTLISNDLERNREYFPKQMRNKDK